MQAMIGRGLLKSTDMVWRDGFTDWQPCHQVFRLTQPVPPPPPRAPQSDPPRSDEASFRDRVLPSKFGEFAISFKTGTVRDVQTITRVTASASSGQGHIGPSANVSSHVTQRVFVSYDDGNERHFQTGEEFPVRVGNRVRVGFVLRDAKSEGGLVKNLDSEAISRWPMNSVLPRVWWFWMIVVVCLALQFATWLPVGVGEVISLFEGFATESHDPERPFYKVAIVWAALAVAIPVKYGLLSIVATWMALKRTWDIKALRERLWNAMEA